MSDINKSVKQVAKEEVQKDLYEQNKERYKRLFKQLDQAKKVVSNIEHEIEDLDLELSRK